MTEAFSFFLSRNFAGYLTHSRGAVSVHFVFSVLDALSDFNLVP